jgi:hypothetical protein
LLVGCDLCLLLGGRSSLPLHASRVFMVGGLRDGSWLLSPAFRLRATNVQLPEHVHEQCHPLDHGLRLGGDVGDQNFGFVVLPVHLGILYSLLTTFAFFSARALCSFPRVAWRIRSSPWLPLSASPLPA